MGSSQAHQLTRRPLDYTGAASRTSHAECVKGEPVNMKNVIHVILATAALAGAVSMSAQTPPAPQPAPAPQAAPAALTAPGASTTPTTPPAETSLTVDDIVGKHAAALGGSDAISKVKSVVLESSITMMGAENPSTTTIVDGVGYKNEMDFNGTKIVQAYTDKGGWTINPMAGAPTATPMPDDVYNTGKGQIYVGDPLFDYAAKGSTVELIGKDGSAYKVKLTSKEKVQTVYLIDSTSFLITAVATKGKMQDQDVDITTKLSDYRKTDLGFTMPYAIDVDLGGQFSLTIAVKKVELNKTIDPAIFAMPN